MHGIPFLGELVGLLSAFAWGTTGLLIRAYLGGVPAVAINALRNSMSAAAFALALAFFGSRQPTPTSAFLFLGFSTISGLALGDSLYFEALKRIGVARAMPISAGYPMLTSVLAAVLLGERLTALSAVGMIVTLVGVYLVAVPVRFADAVSKGSARGYWKGVGLAAVAAVCWSCSAIAVKPALAMVDVVTASVIRAGLASALLWPVAVRRGAVPSAAWFRGRSLGAIAALGVTSVLSTSLFLECVALAGAGTAAVLSATAPVFAIPLSVLFLGERAGRRLGVGVLLTVTGVVLLTVGGGT